MDKRIICPNTLCKAALLLTQEDFGLVDNEDGTWNSTQAITCSICEVTFHIVNSRVTFVGAKCRRDYYEEQVEGELELIAS